MIRILLIPSCGIGPGLNQLCPTDTLLRLRRGLALWKSRRYDKILVTGGIFNPPNIQTVPAAELMKQWLMEQQVSEKNILTETTSLDTYQNIENSLAIIQKYICEHTIITVVTQWQHAIRFWISFRFGYNVTVRLSPMRYPISARTFVHECLFIIHHLRYPTGEKSPFTQRTRNQRAQK